MKLTRREALKLGLIGGSSLILPWGVAEPALAQFSPQIPRFELPLPIPAVLTPVRSDATTDYYEIEMRKAALQILPKPYPMTEIWGYNGLLPGPTIRQRGGKEKEGGRQSVVRFINQLGDVTTVIHLHGMASQPYYDGHAQDYIPPGPDLIPPGYFKDYIYPNDRAATLWYHDHTLDYTARNVYRGLSGMYIVEDEYERNLPLPKGEYDIPLILQDKRFGADGALIFDDGGGRSLYGDVMLVNGAPWPRLEVGKRKYRFRILNSSASRHYNLVLSNQADSQSLGNKMTVIATDGGFLGEPVTLTAPTQALRMGIAERYEVIIDFSAYPVGSKVYLRNLGFTGTIDTDARSQVLMRFDVVREEKDDSEIPAAFQPVPPIAIPAEVGTRTFRFERNQGLWKINNKTWNKKKNRIDADPKEGAVEIWNLINPGSGWVHPVHIHLVDAQILDRNGMPPRPYERGWKDVFLVGELETVRVVMRFGTRGGDYIKGRFMMHCHNLVHEDHSMMTLFEVGKGGLSPTTTAPAKPISEMLPL